MWREPARHAGFLSLEGVGVTRHQVRNWTGSGKITCWISGGTQHFSSENLKEVAKLWIESNGRWRTLYSVYSGMITAEYLNSAQCAGLWACSDRQAKRTIDSGILVGIKVGNSVGGKPCPGSPASLQKTSWADVREPQAGFEAYAGQNQPILRLPLVGNGRSEFMKVVIDFILGGR